MNINVSFKDSTGNVVKVKVQEYDIDDSTGKIKTDSEGNPIKKGDPRDKDASIDMNANKYSTQGLVKDNKLIYDANSPNANLDFQFVEIQPTT